MIDKSKIPKIKKDYMDRGHIQSNNEQIYYHTKRTGIFNSKEKRKSNRSKVQKGNKNAVGNKGGPGAEQENKNALKTRRI